MQGPGRIVGIVRDSYAASAWSVMRAHRPDGALQQVQGDLGHQGQVIRRSSLALELTKLETEWEQKVLRKATRAAQQRGLADLEKFGVRGGVPREVVFPMANASQAGRYIIWSVMMREPLLDASTIRTYCNGVSATHEFLRRALDMKYLLNPIRTARVRRTLRVAMNEYKKPSKAKHHWTLRKFRDMLSRVSQRLVQGGTKRAGRGAQVGGGAPQDPLPHSAVCQGRAHRHVANEQPCASALGGPNLHLGARDARQETRRRGSSARLTSRRCQKLGKVWKIKEIGYFWHFPSH